MVSQDLTQPFLTSLERMYQKRLGGVQASYQKRAWNRFLELGLPSKSHDGWKYLPLQKLYGQTFALLERINVAKEEVEAFILEECRQSCLTFVNGEFCPDLSNWEALPEKVLVLPMDQASKTYAPLIRKNLEQEKNPFALLNTAVHSGGVFLYVPPKCAVEATVQILNIISDQESAGVISPKMFTFCGRGSQLSILTSRQKLSDANKFWFNQNFECILEDAAQLSVQSLDCDPEESWVFESFRALLKRDARLKTVSLNEGAQTIHQDYSVLLSGENAYADLKGVSLLKDKMQSHVKVHMEHIAPHCSSSQLFKNIVDDFAYSSFEGKIYVHSEAQKTDAFQLNNNLLLGDNARSMSKPNLEIFADDVKASHGSTVGQLDHDQLFYLCSRGLTKTDAKALLLNGFAKEVLENFTLPSVQLEASKRCDASLKR